MNGSEGTLPAESSKSPAVDSVRIRISGKVDETLEIHHDRGYVIWIDPKDECDVIFYYRNTGHEFNLYLDPQFVGVQIEEVYASNLGRQHKLIYNGRDDPRRLCGSAGIRLGDPRQCQDRTFKICSVQGVVRIRLLALSDTPLAATSLFRAFKFNYTMVLR